MDERPSFGALLRHHRLAAGLTQEDLAERASLSARAISDLERGVRRSPYPETIARLSEALRLSEAASAELRVASRRVRESTRPDPKAPRRQPFPTTFGGQSISFVGRDSELGVLDAGLAAAHAGHGGLVVLTGDPGIGKTRLAEYFAANAQNSGALALWGQAYEGEVSSPYGPWAQVLNACASMVGATRLRELLGAGAPPIARLVPQVRVVLPETPPAPSLGPDEDRFRLQDAVAQLFLTMADEQPVVLVLDDLHWADGDSLRLLRYVTRLASHARLLLLGTYRDVEVDQRHPLTETLALLRREVDYTRVPLNGWSFKETATYLREAAVQPLPEAFIRYIYEATEGSPFHTREVFRHLTEERSIVNREGRWSTDVSLREGGIPEGVRQVVGRRLARVSDATNTLLRHAAAFTGGFDFGLLPAVTGLGEATLLDCIDEALAAGLIRAVPGGGETYDFAHAIVRHALYNELSPSRRARLHRRIAETLAALEPDSGGQLAANIAVHYHASASVPGFEPGVAYALRAAEQARAAYAPEQAVVLLRIASDMVGGCALARRADVLQRLALAEAEALLLEDVAKTVEAALAALSAAAAETEELVAFLETVARALKLAGAAPVTWEPLVERGLALVGDRRDLLWARLTLVRDRYVAVSSGSINASQWLGHDQEAIALARTVGDEDDYALSLDPLTWREPAETEAVLARVRTWSQPTAVLHGLNVVARDLLFRHGDFRAAAERYQELLTAARRYGSVPGQAEALTQLATILQILGQFVSARQTLTLAQELVVRLGQSHRLHFAAMVGNETALGYYTRADWPALAESNQRYLAGPEALRSPLGLMAAACAALAYTRAGSTERAMRILGELARVVDHLEPHAYMQNHVVCIAGVAIWELEAKELGPLFRRLATRLVHARLAPGIFAHELTAARMAALAGDWPEAEAWFARARLVEDACGQRPGRAFVDLDEAYVILHQRPSDRRRAQTLLRASADQFRTLGMESWLERAEGLATSLTSAPVEHPHGLTGREIEVLQLVASGYTSKEVAARLVVSVATVQRHIANVYAKINARGRADATAYASRHGMLAP